MSFLRTASVVVAVSLASAPPSHGQDPLDQLPPAHIAFVDGSATLSRENQTEPAAPGTPLVPGDRIRTDRGRANVLFPDGSALDLDEYSTLELMSPTVFRLTEGRLLLSVAGVNNPSSASRFDVDTPTASAHTYGPGEYRVSVLSDPSGLHTELAVLRGSGALETNLGTMPVRAAERTVAWDNAAPSYPQSFNSARYDAFDRWAASLRDERTGSASAQYLPSDLRMYGGTLDRNGAWQYEAPYGNVWYPTVAEDWRPYDAGYWSSVPSYGWTWIGVNVWSWPTHHYGRWGYSRSRWFWIPDRRWAPAWVSWGAAPGYVSWCPLGYDNRPVFSLAISGGDRFRGWTALSREHFGGGGRDVRRYAMSARALPQHTAFIEQTSPPLPPRHAVTRRIVGATSVGAGLAGSGSATRGMPVPRQAPSASRQFPNGPSPTGRTRTESPRDAPQAGGPFGPQDRGRTSASGRPAVGPSAAQSPDPAPSARVARPRGAERPAPETPPAAVRVMPPRIGRTTRPSETPAPAAQAPPENLPRAGGTPRRSQAPSPSRTEPPRTPESRPIAPPQGRAQAVPRQGRSEAQPAASSPRAREPASSAEPAGGGAARGSRRSR